MDPNDSVPEQLLCSICLEIPESEVFQCKNGHAICKKCCSNLKQCPECRISYGEGKIRNRALESLLDSLKLDCPHKSRGCQQKLQRGEVQPHSKACKLNPKNMVTERISICKEFGYTQCSFLVDTCGGNMKQVRDHFISKHAFSEASGRGLVIQMVDFEGVSADSNSMWTPIIVNLSGRGQADGPVIIICTSLNSRDKSLCWLSFLLGGNDSSQNISPNFEVEFHLQNYLSIVKDFKWKTSAIPARHARTFMTSLPLSFPIEFIRNHFMTVEGKLSVRVTINPFDKDENKNLSTGETVWIFNHQISNVISTNQIHANKANVSKPSSSKLQRATSQTSVFQLQPPSRMMHRTTSEATLPQASSSSSVINGIKCNICFVSPMTHSYYKCMQCANYNLCSHCMKNNHHIEHVFAMLTDLTKHKTPFNRTSKPIIPFPALKWVRDHIKQEAEEAECCNFIHTASGTNPKACFMCLECSKEDAFFCSKCITVRKLHNHHVLAVTDTERRRQFMMFQFHKRFVPLKTSE